MSQLLYPPSVNALSKQLNANYTAADAVITLTNTTNVQNKPGVCLINRVDTNGTLQATSDWTYIEFTATSGATLTGCTAIAGDQDQALGKVVEFISDVTQQQRILDCLVAEHNDDGTHSAITATSIDIGSSVAVTATLDEDDMASNSATALATQQSIKAYVDSNAPILSTTKFAPSGFLLNGKIVPSVSSNNLTVAIKGMDGNDPSASNPVYCRIGDTVRTITSALSVTKNAGTNWCNSGSAELATKEVDYFVYLGYNSTDGVVIGFSRIPWGHEYGDFSATTTNEKYCAISTITNAASGDDYELVGRFGATLSAGAGYTWTVPTFSNINLIQRPIFNTRWLSFDPTLTPSGSMTYGSVVKTCYYQIKDDSICAIDIFLSGTIGGTPSNIVQMSIPVTFAAQYTKGVTLTYANNTSVYAAIGDNFTATTTLALTKYDRSNLTAGNGNFQGTVLIKF